MTKSNHAITLIALVITIIILLILAGISIAMLTGQNGILNQANKAKEDTNKANEREKLGIVISGSYSANGEIDFNIFKRNLKKEMEIDIQDTEFPAHIIKEKETIIVNKNGEIFTTNYNINGMKLNYNGINNIPEGHNSKTNIWKDSSGNINDCILNGGKWEKDGLVFDGIGEYGLCDTTKNTKEMTIEVLFKVYENNDKQYQGIAGWLFSNVTTSRIGLWMDGVKLGIYTTNGTESMGVSIRKEIEKNKVISYSMVTSDSNKTFKLYNNGTLNETIDNANVSNIESQIPFVIGNYGKNDGQYEMDYSFKGKIYSVRIYNRELNNNEIKENYNKDIENFNISK